MKTIHGDCWQVRIPDDWSHEFEDDVTAIFAEDGFGMLEISGTQHDEEVEFELLEGMAEDHLDSGAEALPAVFGEFTGFEISYDDDGQLWREFYLSYGTLIIYATYNCDEADEEKEVGILDIILSTLSPYEA